MVELETTTERVLLVAIIRKGTAKETVEEHIEELASLVATAGGEVSDVAYQELVSLNPATAIGKGKVQEIKEIIARRGIQLVVFDDELSPVQTKNLENEFQVKVIDRTTLILDIFAKHARTLEAKLQVELAQLQYLLPRLTRMWTHLSKQFGGIGTKGPGETQIETDRRIIKIRIQRLKTKLIEVAKQKQIERKMRESFFRFSLVGYTNAGKSTIMNELTNANVLAEDRLFATLDTTTRSLNLPNGKLVLLSDTVGFIRKLPAHLIASFRSTLSEAVRADALIHVADSSHRFFRDQIYEVENTLASLGLSNKPTILVLNKIDLIDDKEYIRYLQKEFPSAVLISAARGINISSLLERMRKIMEENSKIVKIFLPYNKMELAPRLYQLSSIITRTEKAEGVEFTAKLIQQNEMYFNNLFNPYIIVN